MGKKSLTASTLRLAGCLEVPQCLITLGWSLSNRKQRTCVGSFLSLQFAGTITRSYIIVADTLTRPNNTTPHQKTPSGRPRISLSKTVPYLIIHHQGQALQPCLTALSSHWHLSDQQPQAQSKSVGILLWNDWPFFHWILNLANIKERHSIFIIT